MKIYLSTLLVLQLQQQGLSFAPPSHGYRHGLFLDKKLVVAQGMSGDYLSSSSNKVESDEKALDRSITSKGIHGESKAQEEEQEDSVDDDRLPASDIDEDMLPDIERQIEHSRGNVESIVQKVPHGVNGDSHNVNFSNQPTLSLLEAESELAQTLIQNETCNGQNTHDPAEDSTVSDGQYAAEDTPTSNAAIQGLSEMEVQEDAYTVNGDLKGVGNDEADGNVSTLRTIEQETGVVSVNGVGKLQRTLFCTNDGTLDKVADAAEDTNAHQSFMPFFVSIRTEPREGDSDETMPPDDGTSGQKDDTPTPEDATVDETVDKHVRELEPTVASEAFEAQAPDLEVNGSGTSFTVKVNGDDSNNEERVKHFDEYKVTSMEQLRKNLDEAKERSTNSKERVDALQQKVDELRDELDEAESEFQQYTNIRKGEDESIVARVSELETLLQMKDDKRRKVEETTQSAAKLRQEALMKEIERTKAALCEAEASLNEEKDVAAEIEARLAQAEEQLMVETSAFEGDEKQLLDMIQKGRTKVADAETRIQKEREEFEEVKITLGKELQERITLVAQTNARLQLEQSLSSLNQAQVQRNIDDITAKLRATEQELQSDQNGFQKETNESQQKAQELRELLKEAENKLETEKRKSRQAKEDLDMRLVFEVVKVRNLTEKLNNQQDLFRQEINELEKVSADTSARLVAAQAQLENTRAAFLEEKEKLQDRIANGERIQKLKAKQMSQRYRDIRADLTEKWQGERRQSRSERIRLETKYKTRLSNLQEAVPRLERKLAEVRKITEDLYVRRANTAMEKAAILEESKKVEMRYIQKKQERNIAITALEGEVDDLKSELAERDEKLVKYKSSLRTMLALAIKLTGKRIRATGKRLLDLVRGSKKTSTRGSHQLFNTVRRSVVIDKNEEQ